MGQAIQLARRGMTTTHPNPRVGCVIVKDDHIVGKGWHQVAGQAHAEINALKQANINVGTNVKDATVYVTLEPCCHTGKTPPCTQRLIQAGVKRVVSAMQDPHDKVAGKGLQQLRDAGIQVANGLLETQARELNPGFIKRMQQGLPFIRLKMGMSLDGRTAMASGESQWITSAEAREDVQKFRAQSSAILTGSGTVLQDDPSLTVRLADIKRQPLRVVLDSQLRISTQVKLLSGGSPVVIFTRSQDESIIKPLQQRGAKVITVPGTEAGLNLKAVLERLAELEVNEVLVEAGATLAGSFVSAGLVDELVIYTAPVLMGDNARGLFHLPEINSMSQKTTLNFRDIRQIGPDLRIIATLN